jgi:superfamily II DNA or RNA helicase
MNDLFHEFESGQACAKELRPHQVKALHLIRQSFGKGGNKRTVCQMPTGAGKTITAAEIIKSALAKGSDIVFTAPAVSLIDQTVAAFRSQGIQDIGVMQASHPLTNPLAQVQVATVQTLAQRDMPKASLVIVDEAHVRSSVIDQMMTERDDVYFIGLSATPWRSGMGLTWQDLVIPVTIGELIEGGLLSKFSVYAPDVPDLSGVKISKGEYVADGLSEIMGDSKIVGSIVGNWLEHGERRPTLCFCIDRAHAAQVQAEFQAQGISAAYVDGKTDTVERELINRRFRKGEYAVICSVRTMTTGVDLPVSCIIDAAPTRSEMLHVQKIGRGLRVNDGTEDCTIFDHAGNSLRLGLVTEISHDSLDTSKPGERPERKEAPEHLPKECPKCSILRIGRVCPHCGHEAALPKIDAAQGELVQLSGKRKVPTKADKQEFWSMALWLDRDRYRGGKLAKGLYKGKFGVWPKGLIDIAKRPDAKFMDYEKSRRIAYAKRMEAQKKAGAA